MIPYPEKIIVSMYSVLNLTPRCPSEKERSLFFMDNSGASLNTLEQNKKKNKEEEEREKTARIERKGPTIIPHPSASRKEQLVARQRATHILSLGAPSSSSLYNVSE